VLSHQTLAQRDAFRNPGCSPETLTRNRSMTRYPSVDGGLPTINRSARSAVRRRRFAFARNAVRARRRHPRLAPAARPDPPKLAEIVVRAGRQALLVVADEGVRGQGDHRQPNSGIAAMLDSDSRRSNLGPRPSLRLPQAACMGAKPSPLDPKSAHARAQGVGVDAQELSRTEWPLDAS